MYSTRKLSLYGKANDISTLFRLWPGRDAPMTLAPHALHAKYTSAVSKYPATLPHAYAGRAQCLVWEGQFQAAADDITKALSVCGTANNNNTTTTSNNIKQFCQSLLARSLQGTVATLTLKSEMHQGPVAETQKSLTSTQKRIVDVMKTLLQEDAFSLDWASEVFLGEVLLQVGAVEEALERFESASRSLEMERATREAGEEVLLSQSAAPSVALFIKSWFASVDYTSNQTASASFETATLRATFTSLLRDLNASPAEAWKAYRTAHQLEKLTDEETEAVVRIAALSEMREYGFSRPLRILQQPHSDWDGHAALALRSLMEQFSGNVTAKNYTATSVEKLYRTIKALDNNNTDMSGSTTGDETYSAQKAVATLKALDAAAAAASSTATSGPSTSTVDVLTAFTNEMGLPREVAISESDVPFFTLLKDIDQVYSHIPLGIPGNKTFLYAQKKLALGLLMQQHDRIQLGLAKCHAKMGKSEKALALLSDVYARDAYFSMFDVLESRAAVAKDLGLVEVAEKDYATMHRLLIPLTDIPTFDSNRKAQNGF